MGETAVSDPQSPLRGAVAIVTGASRGIGKGCALELAAAGALVFATGRTLREGGAALPGSLEATVEEVKELGGRCIPVACDHADDEQTAALFERVTAEAGQLDVLVNNAFRVSEKLDPRLPFYETPISWWDDMLDVGTRSAYVATHFAARTMVPQGHGLIANISSAGAVHYFHHVVYGVGKAALDRIAVDCAPALARKGVAIVSLWPHLVKTERVLRIPGYDLSRAESLRFTGRAVVALASDPKVLRWTGRALTSRDLASAYGFRDLDGSLPDGPAWRPPE